MKRAHVAAPLVIVRSWYQLQNEVNCFSLRSTLQRKKVCVCECVGEPEAIKKHTRPSEFEPVQRTEMTSSLPHPALLEDLSKTCGSALPAHCKLTWVLDSNVFPLLEDVCVCVCAQTGFILLSWIFLSLSGFWLHLSFIWIVSACSSGFGRTGSRPAELDSIINRVWALELVCTCLLRPMKSDDSHHSDNL